MESLDVSDVRPVIEASESVVLFANPVSGSKEAKLYLDTKARSLSLVTSRGLVDLHIFDLSNSKARKEGVVFLESLVEHHKEVRVIVAGGDGSLIWAIEEISKASLDLSQIKFGTMPFGTGNDLAAMLGWGRKPELPIVGKNNEGLIRSVESWLAAQEVNFDLWNIQIEVEENGYFEKIHKEEKKFRREKLTDRSGNKRTAYHRLMTNYFSIGLDARIGLGFDKSRSRYRWCNKFIYCWEGLKKICCLPLFRLTEYAASFYENDNYCIFDNTMPEKSLPPSTSIFIALNARTYAGGFNIWDKAQPLREEEVTLKEASPCDGQLEFLTFQGGFSLGLEAIPSKQGRGKKVFQGSGPFTLHFAPQADDRRVYMQIDGEYFYAVRPKCVHISLADVSSSQKLRVLVNEGHTLF